MLLLAAVLLVGTSSCSKDSDGGSGGLNGQWVTISGSSSYKTIVYIDLSGGVYRTTIFNVVGSNLDSSSSTIDHVYSSSSTGTYSVDGNRLISDDKYGATYSISGNYLTITSDDGGTVVYQRVNSELNKMINELFAVAEPYYDY